MRYEQSLDPGEMASPRSSDEPRGELAGPQRPAAPIRCPVLFCWGMHDGFLTPDYPLMLARMVPHGHLYVMDHASHHLQEERPADYHRVVAAFLDMEHDSSDEKAAGCSRCLTALVFALRRRSLARTDTRHGHLGWYEGLRCRVREHRPRRRRVAHDADEHALGRGRAPRSRGRVPRRRWRTASEMLVAAARPDVVVIVGPNHFRGLWLDLMPAFVLGVGEVDRRRRARHARGPAAGRPGVRASMLLDALYDDEFDIAFSGRLTIDHGITHAVQYLLADVDVPGGAARREHVRAAAARACAAACALGARARSCARHAPTGASR